MDQQRTRRLLLLTLIVAALVSFWLDHKHPFPVHVIKNSHNTPYQA